MTPKPSSNLFRCAVLGAALWMPTIALGIGPDYQFITDTTAPNFTGAPAGTLNDVVSLTTPGGGIGSGMVIGISPEGPDQSYTLAILTANHVAAAGVTMANYGANGNVLQMNLTGKASTFTLVDPVNNPNNLPEDLSIVQATTNISTLVGNQLDLFNLVKANVPTLNAFSVAPPASTAPNAALNQNAAVVNFTQYGYGGQGTFNANAPARFVSNGTTGSRMFENNTTFDVAGASATNYGFTNYFEPITRFTAKAPGFTANGTPPPLNSSGNGQGTGMRGDSGGPLLTSIAGPIVSVTPNFGPAGQQVPTPVTLSFVNSETAVYVGVDLATTVGGALVVPDTTNVGWNNYAVPLAAGNGNSLAWADFYAANPELIPEPSSAALLALGVSVLFLRAWRHRKAAHVA